MLLIGAGLFLRSLRNLMNVDTGCETQHVMSLRIDPTAAGYRNDARLRDTMQTIEDHVASIPGVHGAAFTLSLFNGGGWSGVVSVRGRAESDQDPDVFQNIVGTQYLHVMNIPILAGRAFTDRDTSAAQPVAIINETMARAYFGAGMPVGRTFSVRDDAEWRDIQVIGVMRDGKYLSLTETPQSAAFYPRAQHARFLTSFVLRTSGDPKLVVPQVRQAIAQVDGNLPASDFSSMAEVVDRSVENRRLVALLSAAFGILAALLACIGIYGVASYGITRRTNEFGIRMALGAQRGQVLWMVLRETLSLVGMGIVAGIALALLASRLVVSVLFDLKPSDPLSMAAATALLFAVSIAAGWFPAHRATRIDPIVALRDE